MMRGMVSSRPSLRRAEPEGREQLVLLVPGLFVLALLDVVEAAYVLRQARDLDGERQALRPEPVEQLRDGRLVLADQAALEAAMRRPAERVERRAAQAPERPDRAEEREDEPGRDAPLLHAPALGVAR